MNAVSFGLLETTSKDKLARYVLVSDLSNLRKLTIDGEYNLNYEKLDLSLETLCFKAQEIREILKDVVGKLPALKNLEVVSKYASDCRLPDAIPTLSIYANFLFCGPSTVLIGVQELNIHFQFDFINSGFVSEMSKTFPSLRSLTMYSSERECSVNRITDDSLFELSKMNDLKFFKIVGFSCFIGAFLFIEGFPKMEQIEIRSCQNVVVASVTFAKQTVLKGLNQLSVYPFRYRDKNCII